jgi:Tol biopolymer transport system component
MALAQPGPGNGPSGHPAITPDGRYVAFRSTASDLVADDLNGLSDVFVRDRLVGLTVLATVGATDAPLAAVPPPLSLSADGRYAAFASASTNLVAGVTNTLGTEVYARDLIENQTIWLSSNAVSAFQFVHGFPPRGLVSQSPVLSSRGDFAVFKSFDSRGSTGCIFRVNLPAGSLTTLSTNAGGQTLGWPDTAGPLLTTGGTFFAALAPLKVFPEPGGSTNLVTVPAQVEVGDTAKGADRIASATPSGAPSSGLKTSHPGLSDDGRYVSFVSDAQDLTPEVVPSGFHIYLRDLEAQATTIVSSASNEPLAVETTVPFLASDGSLIAFDSDRQPPELDGGNGVQDVLLGAGTVKPSSD